MPPHCSVFFPSILLVLLRPRNLGSAVELLHSYDPVRDIICLPRAVQIHLLPVTQAGLVLLLGSELRAALQ